MATRKITSFTANKVAGPKGSTNPINNILAVEINDFKDTINEHAVAIDSLEAKSLIPGPKGDTGNQGIKGDTGATGAPFTYSMFTTTQLNALKVKGDKGDPFLFSDFTAAQLASLKGAKGDTGTAGTNGTNGTNGAAGTNGTNGWTPVLASQIDGLRLVLKVIDYVGGTGTKPTIGTNNFLGLTGLVALASATDFKGPKGDTGAAGPSGTSTSTTALAIDNSLNTVGQPTSFTISSGTSDDRAAITAIPANLIFFEI